MIAKKTDPWIFEMKTAAKKMKVAAIPMPFINVKTYRDSISKARSSIATFSLIFMNLRVR